MARNLARLAYGAAQSLRVSWYYGQKLAAAARATPAPAAPDEGRAVLPDRAQILRDLRRLLERDWHNIAAGNYRLPVDLVPNPLAEWRRSRRFFADLAKVEARRLANDNSEIIRSEIVSRAPPGRYPRYYLQNFHFQTDGYLSRHSAELYDHQVEVLFAGAAHPMRPHAPAPLPRA